MFGERKLYGIPYFGKGMEEVYHTVDNLDKEHIKTKVYESMYEFIQNEATEKMVVVLKYENKTYLTYLRDIRFNYRDKEIFLPYFTYDTYVTSKVGKKRDGHVLLNENNNILIRYNYSLRKYIISIGNGINDKSWNFILYDIESLEFKNIIVKHKFISNKVFNMEDLYKKYISSCYMQEDFYLNNHIEGYHVINKHIRGISNRERRLRHEYGLNDSIENTIDLNYRDVRQYREEDIIIKKGLIENQDNYWKRILDFESLLYCILRENIETDNEQLNKEWRKLGVSRDIYKYGEDVKLIFKSYWKDNYRQIKTKSWSRVKEEKHM